MSESTPDLNNQPVSFGAIQDTVTEPTSDKDITASEELEVDHDQHVPTEDTDTPEVAKPAISETIEENTPLPEVDEIKEHHVEYQTPEVKETPTDETKSTKTKNYTMDVDCVKLHSVQKSLDELVKNNIIIIPSGSRKAIETWIEKHDNELTHALDELKDIPTQQCKALIGNSIKLLLRSPADLENVVQDSTRDFVQEIDTPSGKITGTYPSFKENTNVKVKGREAAIRIASLTGLSSSISVPLWHSGFWITIRTPSDGDLLEFERVVAKTRVDLGRDTAGYIFGNETVYLNEQIMTLLKDHIVSTSLADNNVDISELISVHDLPIITTYLAAAIWPRGYEYVRPILNANIEERKYVSGIIDLSKICWVDKSALTEAQIRHMEKRRGAKMTLESIMSYREGFKRPQQKKVLINEHEGRKIFAVISVPNVETHIAYGHRWVMENRTTLEEVLSEDELSYDEESITPEMHEEFESRRVNLMVQRIRTRVLGIYRHYVSSFIYEASNGEQEIYDDEETIDELLKTYGSDETIRDKIADEVIKFIDGSLIAIVATPTVDVSENEFTLENFPYLIPLEALTTFFTLIGQKLSYKD